ncbi:hypothetical protein L1887_15848 [Cichorium endivia]|nr:hypothetical protein L1887_15848 [Cichorium endivia]
MPSRHDYISNLPESIIETILIKLPLRDAVRTSILSSKWRYKWATLTHLEFNDQCVSGTRDRPLAKFISRALLLHNGPINRFVLSTSYLQITPDVDQWLLFLSRKDVKELALLHLGGKWFRAPSFLFSCQKLIRLELLRWSFYPPLSFKGFPFLKHLIFLQVSISRVALQNLISSCPLLESLELLYDALKLTIRAPNLKFLYLEGDHFEDVCLEYTPKLVAMNVSIYSTYGKDEHFGQISTSNFDKFLGGVPSLERLIGHCYFTKVRCNTFGKKEIKYQQLKVIELSGVSFDTMKEIMVVLRLILNAPNLLELQIEGSSGLSSATEAPDLGFWEKECLFDCTFERLKMVKMTNMVGVPHEVGFIGFLLGKSPVLETISITPSVHILTKDRLSFVIELTKLRRTSPEAEMIFVQN